jgi:hypothetical protein
VIKITIEPQHVAGIMKRDWNRVLAAGLKGMGESWHLRYLARHFEPSAVRRYGYAPRSAGYRKRKRRIKGHDRPLVWSGRSERLASMRRVRATSKGVSVIVYAPQLNRRKLAKEVTTVIVQEIGVLNRQIEKYIARRMPAV